MMRRLLPILGSALFLVIAPGTLVGFVPWWLSGWEQRTPFPGFMPLRLLGIVLIAAALPVLLESFARFALEGLGTPAPVFPTRHLVVSGAYRFVRNPIYIAVTSMIAGQALLLGRIGLLIYAALLWLGFHLFVLAYEEPKMRASFGAEYEAYCARVPRWLPR